jgi:N-acetylglucosaminyldiphosphoundecaprenol N-acetyl-beta-D-mannosaminyltransferase
MTRIRFYGTPVDLLSMDETIARADAAMRTKSSIRHTALNVAKLVKLQRDPELATDVIESDIVGIDGMGIIVGLRLFGIRKAERVSGVDLMLRLLEHCAREGYRPYILGARQGQLEKAANVARQRYPGLEFAGLRNGYFRPEDEAEVVEDIRSSRADCLFVAMPTPRKERFLHRYFAELDVPFIMGVGGSVDVLAGHVSRAPQWMQAIGLEWLHRLLKEPRKMFWRYASTNAAYGWMLLKSLVMARHPVESRPR